MDKQQLKALIMAMMSPNGIGGVLNDVSFKNLDANATRIVEFCCPEPELTTE